jgi:cold shock CspA family protein
MNTKHIPLPGIHSGIVVHFHPLKGFGYIHCESLNRRFFFHVSHWHHVQLPLINQPVTFNTKESGVVTQPDKAVDVRPVLSASITPDALVNTLSREVRS